MGPCFIVVFLLILIPLCAPASGVSLKGRFCDPDTTRAGCGVDEDEVLICDKEQRICVCDAGAASPGESCKVRVFEDQTCNDIITCRRSMACLGGNQNSGFKCQCLEGYERYTIDTKRNECRVPRSYGNPCGSSKEPCLPNQNLACVNGTCVCGQGFVRDGYDGQKCSPPGRLNSNCGILLPDCDTMLNLICTPQLKCQCSPGSIVVNGICEIDRAKYNEPCENKPCTLNSGFVCEDAGANRMCMCTAGLVKFRSEKCGPPAKYNEISDDAPCAGGDYNLEASPITNRCVCTETLVFTSNGKCGPPAKFGEKCDHPTCESGPTWNLMCKDGGCVCTEKNVEHEGKKCGPPSKIRQRCERPYPACGVHWNLTCVNGNCGCIDGKVEHPDEICGDPRTYNEQCDSYKENDRHLLPCKTNVNLKCDETLLVCLCDERRMVHDITTGGCKLKPKSTLDEECELEEDCVLYHNIYCLPPAQLCQCEKNHEPDPDNSKMCRWKPADYQEPCNKDEHCRQPRDDHHLVCDLQFQVCICDVGYDVDDDSGGKVCLRNKFNGKTYGSSCDTELAGKNCVVDHNLECEVLKCTCMFGFIPDRSTLDDDKIGVITCKLGEGSLTRGMECSRAPSRSNEKCDETKFLRCEENNNICVCENGFVPTKTDDTFSCSAGDKLYNTSCDPSEVIQPPRKRDPVTGLIPPGPTPIPPPKTACDPTMNLVCINGKCACKDEGISFRYRVDPSSGRCLTSPGYDCINDDECASGKCEIRELNRTGNSKRDKKYYHSHDTKVCCCPAAEEKTYHSRTPTQRSHIPFLLLLHILHL